MDCYETSIWISGFHGAASDVNILYVELLAIKIGLLHAWMLGYRVVVCEFDSLEVVCLCSFMSLASYHLYGALVADIIAFRQRDWTASIQHFLCKANSCVDSLAHMDVEWDKSLVILAKPPTCLQPLLLAYAVEVMFIH